MFNKVSIIGVGLIGSSFAQAVKKKKLANTIVAYDTSDYVKDKIVELNIADEVTYSLESLVKDADLVMICTPLGTYRSVAEGIAPHLKKGCIVSDVGSVKGTAMKDIAPLMPSNVHFIPGHPIAGTEFSGPEAGFAELFEERWCILTPAYGTDQAAIDKLSETWKSFDMEIEFMDPYHHDKVLAITSHLPHMCAFTIVGTADELEADLKQDVIKFSASGFRDFTRVAASDPVVWRDVFLHNKEAVLDITQRFIEDLTALQKHIRRGEGDKIEQLFKTSRDIKRGIMEAKQYKPEAEKDGYPFK
ncbi:MAG: prephenate/arogenate dehydrogenase family protein [Alphaproteobacteria bacterium]|nr:prephenate/arogenate dehydrogenase family protein [Alphaproteobacteria bacterium]